MGSKRSYADEDPLQLPCKYLKQFATDERRISFNNEKLVPMASDCPGNKFNDKLNILAEHNSRSKLELVVDPFEVKNILEAQTMFDKGLVDHLHFPWISDGQGDDRGWCRDSHASLSSEYFEFNIPRARSAHVYVDESLPFFLDRYPRKEVPVGANHQADLPEWAPNVDIESRLSAPIFNRVIVSDRMEKYIGTCVIPVPDSLCLADICIPAETGLKDCDCVDTGSVWCVRQHVKEARIELLEDLGDDKFQELGFVEMGEEVAHEWTNEEEKVVHEVVFSNPASHGKDFWSCLSEEFPSRSMRDFVSYYFNVFMLRKRAAQNRSRVLDIDSDGDEWHPGHSDSYDIGFVGEEDNLMLVSDEDDSRNDDNSKVDEVANFENADKREPSLPFPHKDGDFILGNRYSSCHSFDHPSSVNNSTSTETSVLTKGFNELKSKYFKPVQTDPRCFGYSCNFRQWDQRFSSGLDHLLPTSNIIEEIFGPGSWDGHD